MTTTHQLILVTGISVMTSLMLNSCAVPSSGGGASTNQNSTSPPSVTAEKSLPNVSWDFTAHGDDSVEPRTSVYLVVNDTRHRISPFSSRSYQTLSSSEAAREGVPQNHLIACKGWFAGDGEVLYVKAEAARKLTVYSKEVGEGATPGSQYFKEIKTVSY